MIVKPIETRESNMKRQSPDFLTLPIPFARDQNRTLYADYRGPDGKELRLIVIRAGKGRRLFYGKVDGQIVVRGTNERETIYNLHQWFSAW